MLENMLVAKAAGDHGTRDAVYTQLRQEFMNDPRSASGAALEKFHAPRRPVVCFVIALSPSFGYPFTFRYCRWLSVTRYTK
jgi:hypothetical protein